jgi:hypothetical protein
MTGAADAVGTHPAMVATNRVDAARVLEAVNIIVPFPISVMGRFIAKPLFDCQSHPSYFLIRYKFKILSVFSIA